MTLAETIKAKAIELGFDKVGVARADALVDDEARLREWLDGGLHGTMAWLEREPEKRADPRVLFPGAKSVVAVALNYYTPHEHADSPSTGKVSRYAWGDDYHDILKEKLKLLLEFVQTVAPDANGKACVDTAPIMDKAWAARAGIGWIGKHSNLITKELGSWVFLGELVLDVELDYDKPVEDHCGTCTACLDECPTQAITAPYIVDSRACLSYATIEFRAPELPEEIVQNMNGWLYGCDICQDVCPWNRFEKPASETRFEPRSGNVNANLDEIVAMTPEDFAGRFRRSAMKRTKIGGLQRNALALKKKSG